MLGSKLLTLHLGFGHCVKFISSSQIPNFEGFLQSKTGLNLDIMTISQLIRRPCLRMPMNSTRPPSVHVCIYVQRHLRSSKLVHDKCCICSLIETDACQSILSLNTFGPEGSNMALALSECQIEQSQTLRQQYDHLCVSVHMNRE